MVLNARRMLIVIALLMLSVGFSASVSAQATEQADPRAVVLQALDRLKQDGNYQFAEYLDSAILMTNKDKETFAGYSFTLGFGEIASNGDAHTTYRFGSGNTEEEAHTTVDFQLERVILGGETYVNWPANGIYGVKFKAGWWRYADLLRQPLSSGERAILQSEVESPLPSESPLGGISIISATVAGTETIGGVETRIYDLNMNVALSLLIAKQHKAATNYDYRLTTLFENARLICQGDVTGTDRFWIGVADGRIYQMLSQSSQELPYLTLGIDPYDIGNYPINTLMVTYPDQPITITPPDSSLLNH